MLPFRAVKQTKTKQNTAAEKQTGMQRSLVLGTALMGDTHTVIHA